MDASYLKMAFHERHTIGHQCGIGPQNLLIRHKLSNSGYMTTEDGTGRRLKAFLDVHVFFLILATFSSNSFLI